MGVIGHLFESGEWPELKEKMHDYVVVTLLNVFVKAYLELKKAAEAFATYSGNYSKWDGLEVDYWNEFRRLKSESEKATRIKAEAWGDLKLAFIAVET